MHHVLLQYIDETARQGSIRKAAKVLNVASSAVNRQILKIEEEFNVRIFDRTPDGVELNSTGRAVVEHCRKTLMEYKDLRARIDDIRDLRIGFISISTLDSLTFEFLPAVLETFQKNHPGVSFAIVTAGPEETQAAVASGDVEIGISFTRTLHPDVRVIAKKATPFGIVVRPDHPLADRHYVNIEDCAPFPLIRTIDARDHKSVIDQEVENAALPLSAVIFTNALVMAKQAILAGRGIGIYTKIAFLSDIKNHTLNFIPLADPNLSEYKVGIIISAHRNLSTAAQIFANEIALRFRKSDFS